MFANSTLLRVTGDCPKIRSQPPMVQCSIQTDFSVFFGGKIAKTTTGGQRGAARHKIFALQFEDISLGYKGSCISINAIRDLKQLVSYKIKS